MLIIRVVDCSDFPLAVGHGPFVVLSDIDVVFLNDFPSKDDRKAIDLGACFCYNIPI